MTNISLFNSMIDRYNALSFTHEYVFGFRFNGNIYMVVTDSRVLPSVLKLDKASRGAGYALRFKPTVDQKMFLMAQGATVICSEKYFNEQVAGSKWNKGQIYEKLVTEYFGQIWHKDSVPFTDDGDVTVDGIAYQIKYESATFTNEKILARLA